VIEDYRIRNEKNRFLECWIRLHLRVEKKRDRDFPGFLRPGKLVEKVD